MRLEHNNPSHMYQMNGQSLSETKEEKDIGVTVSANLKPTKVRQSSKNSPDCIGSFSRAFHYRNRHVSLRLYKQYVRPHLEFEVQAWSPWTEGN
jgi:hypothetical protein